MPAENPTPVADAGPKSRWLSQLVSTVSALSLMDVLQFIWTAIKYLPAAVTIFIVLVLVPAAMFDDSTVIDNITVPASLTQQGFTPDVIAAEISDAVKAELATANTEMRIKEIKPISSDFMQLLAVDDSFVFGLVSKGLEFLKLSRRTYISGEVFQDDNKYWLKLRTDDGRNVMTTVNASSPRGLFVLAADQIINQVQPYLLAIVLYSRHDQHSALGQIDGILSRFPHNNPNVTYAYGLLGNMLLAQHMPVEAEHVLRTGVALDAKLGMLRTNLGNALSDEGRYPEAVFEYQTAHRLQPHALLPLQNLAFTYAAMGKFDDAAKEFRAAIDIQPANASLRAVYGEVLRRHNDLDGALAQFLIASEIDPLNPERYIDLGVVWMKKKRFPEAAEAFNDALRYDNKSTSAHFQLALLSLVKLQTQFDAGQSPSGTMVEESLAEACTQLHLSQAYLQGVPFKRAVGIIHTFDAKFKCG